MIPQRAHVFQSLGMTWDSRVFRMALHHWNCLRLLRQSVLLFECLSLMSSKHYNRPSSAALVRKCCACACVHCELVEHRFSPSW